MRGGQSERRTSCTVTVERNRYGAMTLRSERGRTYQIVGGKDPVIESELDRLSADSQVAVTLTRAPGRGDGWWVTEIESQGDRDQLRHQHRSR